MEATITLHTRDLTPESIRAIQERFGDAQLEIKVSETTASENILSEKDFWLLLDLLDWSQEDQSAVVQPVIEALRKKTVSEIYNFADQLAYLLWQLDTPAHAKAYLDESVRRLSVDGFLYARCAVVANGQGVFEEIRNHPDQMPCDVDFESLLYLAERAYQEKTGEEFIHIPLFNFETYGNTEAWEEKDKE